jgi:hypothetical protein
MKLIEEIKKEYRVNKISTLFMGAVVVLSVLTYLKPNSTENILGYIGMSAINFFSLSALVVLFWWFFIRGGKLK